MEKFTPIKAVSVELGVSVPVLKREINRGRLKAYKIAGRVFVYQADLEAYLTHYCRIDPAKENEYDTTLR